MPRSFDILHQLLCQLGWMSALSSIALHPIKPRKLFSPGRILSKLFITRERIDVVDLQLCQRFSPNYRIVLVEWASRVYLALFSKLNGNGLWKIPSAIWFGSSPLVSNNRKLLSNSLTGKYTTNIGEQILLQFLWKLDDLL